MPRPLFMAQSTGSTTARVPASAYGPSSVFVDPGGREKHYFRDAFSQAAFDEFLELAAHQGDLDLHLAGGAQSRALIRRCQPIVRMARAQPPRRNADAAAYSAVAVRFPRLVVHQFHVAGKELGQRPLE